MLTLFEALVGDISGINPDLVFVFAALFYLFVITEIIRFLELGLDFIFRRKK